MMESSTDTLTEADTSAEQSLGDKSLSGSVAQGVPGRKTRSVHAGHRLMERRRRDCRKALGEPKPLTILPR